MQYIKNRSISNLLQTDPELRKFTTKVEQLEQINHIISSNLDPALASHCHVANLRDGILILSTSGPAWNHKLRFSAMDLLSRLRADPRWSGLKSIEVRVDYLPSIDESVSNNSKKIKPISAANVQIIKQLAENIKDHSLAAALKRLVES